MRSYEPANYADWSFRLLIPDRATESRPVAGEVQDEVVFSISFLPFSSPILWFPLFVSSFFLALVCVPRASVLL